MNDFFYLDSTDISPDGVFLSTDLLFSVGDEMDLEFLVPGSLKPVKGQGKVVRVNGSDQPPGPGVAVKLTRLKQIEKNAIIRMIAQNVRAICPSQ